MKASDLCISMIKSFEGFSSKAYICPAGKWTIGWGHTANVKRGDTISYEKAKEFLSQDIRQVEIYIERLHLPNMTQGKMDALVSWCFNFGAARLKSTTLYQRILRGDSSSDVQKEFRKWVHAKDKNGKYIVLPGLVKRRNWEAEQWEK